MSAVEPSQIAAIEPFLEPGDTIITAGLWWQRMRERKLLSGDVVTKTRQIALVLTEHRLYAFDLRIGGVFPLRYRVHSFWWRGYERFTNWNFITGKDRKGRVRDYTFWFQANDGLPSDVRLWTSPEQAEPFIEVFNAAMARVAALTSGTDVAGQISALHTLWADGVLTDEEYARSKQLFLGRPVDAQEHAARTLRNLKQLHREGVLTDAEFATKKWQVLTGSPPRPAPQGQTHRPPNSPPTPQDQVRRLTVHTHRHSGVRTEKITYDQ